LAWWWRATVGRARDAWLRRYLPRVDRMTTVSDPLAIIYRRRYGVEASTITNAAAEQDLTPSAVDPRSVRLVYAGGAMRARRLEILIDAVAMLPEVYSLDLYLVGGDPGYRALLGEHLAHVTRVRVFDAVAMSEVPAVLNAYDIGLHVLPPTSLNHRHALPNKLFEFIQARLAVVVSHTSAVGVVVARHGLGRVVTECSADAFAAAIASLSSTEIEAGKRAAHVAAGRLNAESEMERLRALVAALGRGGTP